MDIHDSPKLSNSKETKIAFGRMTSRSKMAKDLKHTTHEEKKEEKTKPVKIPVLYLKKNNAQSSGHLDIAEPDKQPSRIPRRNISFINKKRAKDTDRVFLQNQNVQRVQIFNSPEDVSQIQKEQSNNTVIFRNFFKTTNENVKEWLSSELEKPTRDNETGYHSVNSPRNCPDPSPHSSSKEFKADLIRKYSMLFKKRREPKKSVSTADISKKSSTANSAKSKSTKLTDNREVTTKNLLPKMNTDIKPLKPSNVGFYATFKFPSTPNPTKRREHGTSAGAGVPSYVECASEVLQKTTNFETEGRDTPSTLNGKENLPNSSQVLDDVSEITDQLDWRLPSSQCSTIFKTSKESETTVSTWHGQRDLSSDYSAFKYQVRMLHYLQRYHFDNADVQTTLLVYHETGTDARALAQKSAAITTENFQIATRNELVGSNTSTVPKNNHVNVGPSIFPMVVEKQKPQMISEAISTQKSKFSMEPKLRGSELMKNSKYIETDGTDMIINTLPISPTVTIKAESMLPSGNSKRNDSVQLISNKGTDMIINPLPISPTVTIKAESMVPSENSNRIDSDQLISNKDTLIPCKRLENRGLAKLRTPKGTVLSCAGTKITSVSSVNLQTCSVFCKPASTINTAMTTNLVSTRNTQCFTAPSLFRRRQRDTSIGLDVTLEEMKHDDSTSTNEIRDLKCDIDFRPTTSTVFTNTELEVTEPIVLINASVLTDRSKYTTETCAQYSSKGKNDSLESEHIGRSQLMSVRMLGDSVSDMSTQAQPLLIDAETRTIPKGITSAAVFTSRFELGRNPRDSKENAIDLGTAEVKTDIKANKEMPINSQQETSPPKQPVIPSQAEKSNLVQPRHPSVVISSNLNAAKWMKGCTKDDYQSIIDISEVTVSESLEKATLAVATSNAFNSNLSAKPEPAVNCMSTQPHVISTINLADVLPKNEENTQPTNDRQGTNEDEQRESALQVRPNTCDAGINVKLPLLIERRSATVHTSRHILNTPKKCHAETADCLYVYDRARCVVHSQRTDMGVQIKSTHSGFGQETKVKPWQGNRTVGLVTSVLKPHCCHKHTSGLLGEVLTPQVYKTLYETSKLIAKDRSLSKEIGIVENKAERSVQVLRDDWSCVICPYCAKRFTAHEIGNLVKKHLPMSRPERDFVEACTMKPSGRQDKNCQAKFAPEYLCQNCILPPTASATDIRGEESHDLRTVYYFLAAIEGRVRRLKQNL
ncbi:unnamed protein product [Pieris brassicae]|uniref:Uncharacterized protein n=1 Tax=Pieris brassicae TaxID=7116 RepID=A0A9P0TBL7_PIEBR|nr:unnamed protein product [Pieris brassicae]